MVCIDLTPEAMEYGSVAEISIHQLMQLVEGVYAVHKLRNTG